VSVSGIQVRNWEKLKGIGFLLVVVLCLGSVRAQEVRVELTRGMTHASPAPTSTSDSAIVVSLSSHGDVYLGGQHVTKDQLGEKIRELSKQIRKNDKIVYLAAEPGLEYQHVVDVLLIIRAQDIGQIALMVDRAATGETLSGMFVIEVPLFRDADEDVSTLKPNPLTLVVAMSTELELRLNSDDRPPSGTPCFNLIPNGVGRDPANLQKWLSCLFDRRTKLRAFKAGMETRTDVPLEERIEKIVFVKAPRSVKYGDVLRVIDAVKGAGANPIGLQIDDLVG